MTFGCTLTMTGTSPERSARAFLQSYNETSQARHYQQYQSFLENFFQSRIERNVEQMNVDAHPSSFSMKVDSNQIQFISDSRSAIKYEYGSGTQAPKRFMQPAVIDTANQISQLIISDAISIYNRNVKFTMSSSEHYGFNGVASNYLNKYSRMLL